MLNNCHVFNRITTVIGECTVSLALAILLSGCGSDLSDLDALARQNAKKNAVDIEVTAQLSEEQVVSPSAVSSDSDADANLIVNLDSNVLSGQVNVNPSQNATVQQVQIRRGYGGQNGNLVLNLSQDVTATNQWNVPGNSLLSDEVVGLLLRGGLYVLVTTAKHMNGELRGQLLLDGQELLITELSGANLIPEVTTNASGKAFLTPIGFDGTAQAVVRVSGITPLNVMLFRANNLNTTEKGQVLYNLEASQDYWVLPSGIVFGQKEFNDIGNGKLMFVVTSAGFPLGEIGGKITYVNQ